MRRVSCTRKLQETLHSVYISYTWQKHWSWRQMKRGFVYTCTNAASKNFMSLQKWEWFSRVCLKLACWTNERDKTHAATKVSLTLAVLESFDTLPSLFQTIRVCVHKRQIIRCLVLSWGCWPLSLVRWYLDEEVKQQRLDFTCIFSGNLHLMFSWNLFFPWKAGQCPTESHFALRDLVYLLTPCSVPPLPLAWKISFWHIHILASLLTFHLKVNATDPLNTLAYRARKCYCQARKTLSEILLEKDDQIFSCSADLLTSRWETDRATLLSLFSAAGQISIQTLDLSASFTFLWLFFPFNSILSGFDMHFIRSVLIELEHRQFLCTTSLLMLTAFPAFCVAGKNAKKRQLWLLVLSITENKNRSLVCVHVWSAQFIATFWESLMYWQAF